MTLKTLTAGSYMLNGLSKINILLGKNGCGKSTLLRTIEKIIVSMEDYGAVKYITPERGGVLVYSPNLDNNMSNNDKWLSQSRGKNRLENFREQSVAQFKNLETLFLRELEATPQLRENLDYSFNSCFNQINTLLDNIEIKRKGSSFKIYKKGTDEEVSPEAISSGESELISLSIECLVFKQQRIENKSNILLLDEPDVHLHPDLQTRLSVFLKELVANDDSIIIVATHSAAFLGALEDFPDANIAFMQANQDKFEFSKISDEYKKILPVFGANPLSNIFNKMPIFLVEGDDDERIWQQAVRTSSGKLRIYPCSTDGEANMSRYERDVESIINSVYDNAKAFSLRDRDETTSEIEDGKIIKRYKLGCRASENLLLSDEVLQSLGCSWDDVKNKINDWTNSNESHKHYDDVLKFKNGGYSRKDFDLKTIRNDLMHIIGSPMAWEVAIGRVIGDHFKEDKFTYSDGSIGEYLGKDLVSDIK